MNKTQMRRKRKRNQGRIEAVALILAVTALATAIAWRVPGQSWGSGSDKTQTGQDVPTREQKTVQTPEVEEEPQITLSMRTNTETPEETETPEPKRTYMGEFTVTAYCSCEICCGEWANNRPNGIVYTASGAVAEEGVTVGASWDVIPKGAHIEIEGLGERIVQDRPADWIVEKYEGRILDVYFSDHQRAQEYGKHTVDVWLIEDTDGKEE